MYVDSESDIVASLLDLPSRVFIATVAAVNKQKLTKIFILGVYLITRQLAASSFVPDREKRHPPPRRNQTTFRNPHTVVKGPGDRCAGIGCLCATRIRVQYCMPSLWSHKC